MSVLGLFRWVAKWPENITNSKSASWSEDDRRRKPVTTLMIDFDVDKPLLKKYAVTMQSTLIGFKGVQEVGRSVQRFYLRARVHIWRGRPS